MPVVGGRALCGVAIGQPGQERLGQVEAADRVRDVVELAQVQLARLKRVKRVDREIRLGWQNFVDSKIAVGSAQCALLPCARVAVGPARSPPRRTRRWAAAALARLWNVQ